MLQHETPKRLRTTKKTKIEDLPLDNALLNQVFQRYKKKSLSVCVYGDPEGNEEKSVFRRLQETGVPVRVVASGDKRLVVKLKNHMKFIVLKIEPKNLSSL